MQYDKCAFHILDYNKDHWKQVPVINEDILIYGAAIVRSIVSCENVRPSSRWCISILISDKHMEFESIKLEMERLNTRFKLRRVCCDDIFFNKDIEVYKTSAYLTIDSLLEVISPTKVISTTALMNIELLLRQENEFK